MTLGDMDILGVTLGVLDILGVTLGVAAGDLDGEGEDIIYGFGVHCVSHFTKNVISVLDDIGIGAAILAIANKSPASLYKPTVLT